MISRSIVILIAGLILSGCATPQMEQISLFPEWKPNIDQPISQLEEILGKLEQQQSINYTISNVAFLYDAKLYILFHDFISALPESARAPQTAEQREWLKQRKMQVHEAYSQYDGGTLASYTAGQASITATKKRIAEIDSRMKELPTTP